MTAIKKEIIILRLYKKYYDAIVSGDKTIEYRKAPFWKKRLIGKKIIHFYNGYPKKGSVNPLVCRILKIDEVDDMLHIHIQKEE